MSSGIGNQLFGNNNMSLALSHNNMVPQIHHDQNAQSSNSDLLMRFGGTRSNTPQFDHILQPPTLGSSHQTIQTAPFFMPQSSNQNQNYHDQGLIISNKPFQGLIQLSDLNTNNNTNTSSASTLFNLPFLSNKYSDQEQQFNTEGSNNFFSENTLIGPDHHHHHQTSDSTTAPSLFSTSLQNNNISHMSATALLQKAAQMGAATSTNTTNNNNNNTSASSLLRSLASKSDHHRPLSAANYGTIFNNSGQDMMNIPGFEAYDNHGGINKEQKLSSIVGSDDRLTRDFLGVTQPQQQQREFNLSTLEVDTNNAAPSGQSFGGGGNFQ